MDKKEFKSWQDGVLDELKNLVSEHVELSLTEKVIEKKYTYLSMAQGYLKIIETFIEIENY